MTAIDRFISRLLAGLPAAEGLRERVREEIEAHLHDAKSDLEQAGMPAAEAERQALDRFGSPEAIARRFRQELGLFVRALYATRATWWPAGGLAWEPVSGL